MSKYTHTNAAKTRTWRLYGCAKRGCDKVNLSYESFRGGDKGYCLDHIPLRYRIKVWWQEYTTTW